MIGNMKIKKPFGIAAGRLLLLLSYRPRALRPNVKRVIDCLLAYILMMRWIRP